MKVLLVTFSDNADHQDTVFGLYEKLQSHVDTYLLAIRTPKVPLEKSNKTWLVDCPERPGVCKKTFNLPLLMSLIHRIRKEKFDAIYFESLHVWNLPIMMMSGRKTRTYQVIHEVVPHYNAELVATLNAGKTTFKEKGLDELFADAINSGIKFTTEYQVTDTYVVSVPTPYDKFTKKVDACYVVAALKSVMAVCGRFQTPLR